MEGTSLIVIGGLNTDIIANGVKRFPDPGEHVYAKELIIGPGGKSRNIATMAGLLLREKQVAMVGRTAQDAYGLWKLPLDALNKAGVDTDFVRVMSADETDKFPAIALIPVTEAGENQIFVIPGVSEDFDSHDIDAAQELFEVTGRNGGFLCATLECPFETVRYAFQKARSLDIKILLDPGGITGTIEVSKLLEGGIFLIKPNEHEAKMMTGITVSDFATAKQAAQVLRTMGAENVLITQGEDGAYLFAGDLEVHILVDRSIAGEVKDATGCGDQTMATLCAWLQAGKSIEEAARAAVLSGTLQFHKAGIQPITLEELAKYSHDL